MCDKYNFPPGPSSTSNIDPGSFHTIALDHKEKYGDISYINLKGTGIVFLNSVESIREGLNSNALMDRPRSFSQKYIFVGDVARQPYSEGWQRLREAMVTGILSMQEYTDAMLAAQNREFSYLHARLKELKNVTFDPREIISASVINGMIIGLIGSRFEYEHDIFECFKKFEENGFKIFGDPKAHEILNRLPFLRHLCFGYGRNFQLTQEAIAGIFQYLFHDIKRVRTLEDGMVPTLLRIQKDDPSFTDDNMTAVILDMHFGGSITMSAALHSLFHQLFCHPEIQRRLQDEIDTVIGQDRSVTPGDMEKMPYTRAILLELFRQCPMVPSVATRSNRNDATICGYHFPADTVFVSNIFGVNHNENVWPDPWKFDPHRFLDENGLLVAEDHAARRNLVTFGDGRRACPGQDFAHSRLFLYVVNVFQKFDIYHDDTGSLSNGNPIHYTNQVILSPPFYTIKVRERVAAVPVM